jgi:PHD/YefM family antitoxin component YafN of YafNO toxin-antitoxin module
MDDRVRIDGDELDAAIGRASDGQPVRVVDAAGHEAVVISPTAYEELQRLRLEEQRRQVRGRLVADAGSGQRFTSVDAMVQAADAGRSVRGVA